MNIQPVAPRNPLLQRYQAQRMPRPQNAAFPQMVQIASDNALAFWIGAVFTFLTFSHSIEFIDTSGRLHLAMLNAALGFLALIATGNGPAMLFSRQGKWLTGFTFWVFIGLPFSMWKGGSVSIFTNGYVKSFIAFFLIGGLIFSLRQMRKILGILALGTAALSYITYRSGVSAADDRISATYGSLGNANDLAATILMGLPFLTLVVMDKRANKLVRLVAAPMIFVLLGIVAKTGSRGALVGIAAMFLVTLTKVSMTNRLKLIVLAGVLAVIAPLMISRDLRDRYMTLFGGKYLNVSENTISAEQSSNARREVMKHALILTAYHPIFGVGLGQLAMQSANMWIAKGETPMWFTAHDIFLLVSSETGVPAFILYVMLIVSCFKDLMRLSRASKESPELTPVSEMALALLMSLVAFVVCGIFNTDAFSIQLPMLAALTAALVRVSANQVATADQARLDRMQPMPSFADRRLARLQTPANF
jgi:O-antigen ligase